MTYRHKKSLGQHFLTDKQVINAIITAINPHSDDVILEIGPGMGALTKPLLSLLKQLIAIELDKELAIYWQQKKYHNLILHQADILKFDLNQLPTPLRIVGNLPYQISAAILIKMLENRHLIKDICFMLQKEVGQRITAKPSTKSYGRLSVILQYYFQIDYRFEVANTAFKPLPKVDSALLTLIPKKQTNLIPPANLLQIVRLCFATRRKTLKNCLKSHLTQSQTQINLNRRAEELSVAEFIQLSQDYEQKK